MKKIIIAIIVFILALAFTLPIYADPATDNFGGNGQAWDNDYGDHFENMNNGANRKDWTNHRFAQPGKAWAHANDNAAVMDNGGYSLVDPHDTMP